MIICLFRLRFLFFGRLDKSLIVKTISRLQYFTEENLLLTFEEQVKKVSSLGCDFIHLKMNNFSKEECFKTAKKSVKIARKNNAKLIVWDHPEIAEKVGADGIHFSKTKPIDSKVFKKLKAQFILGSSVNNLDDILKIKNDFDYLFLGPYENRGSKDEGAQIIGITGYKTVIDEMAKKNLNIPVLAAGGIRLTDVAFLAPSGIYGLAISCEALIVHDVPLEIKKFQAAIISGWEI
ncbi:MAG: hypothetical protein CMP67_03040 [Flavobacteriales bacterium]|nr:hypothetical protein [Flavobacteriales bacterium]